MTPGCARSAASPDHVGAFGIHASALAVWAADSPVLVAAPMQRRCLVLALPLHARSS